MSSRQEYLDICERSLRKYLSLYEKSFEVDHSIMMLECHVICRNQLENEHFGDIICFLCASICIDCLDPTTTAHHDEISRKFERIHHFIRATYEGGKDGKHGVSP